MKRLIEQLVKFGIVGVLATLIDFVLMIALHEVLGVPPVAASTLSFAISTVFNYLASMRFVFTHREDLSTAKEFTIFVVLSLIGLALNALIMWAGGAALGALGIDYSQGFSYVLVKCVATGIVMAWNFVSRKIWLDAD